MKARHLVTIAALLTLGCTDLTAPELLAGTWRQVQTIPGSSLEFTLSTNGSVVTGSGQWTGEACCAGTVAVSGDETGQVVHLTFDYTVTSPAARTFTSRFDGQLRDANTLSGLGSAGSAPITFERVR